MGILPLELPPQIHVRELGLTPSSRIEIDCGPDDVAPRASVPVRVETAGRERRFIARALVETAREAELLRHGGVLPFMLHRTVSQDHEKSQEPQRKAV